MEFDTTSRPPAEALDERDPGYNDAYYELAGAARARCPVRQTDGTWFVSSFEHVRDLAQDWQHFSSANIHTGRHGGGRMVPIEIDPPVHREWRRILNPFFSPDAVRRRDAAILAIVDELLDEFPAHGEHDAVGGFTRPLPGLVIFREFLRVPPDHVAIAQDAADRALNRGAQPFEPDVMYAGFERVAQLSRDLLVARRAEPGDADDLLTGVLAAELDGQSATFDDMVGAVKVVIFGSLTTTQSALSSMLLFLADNPQAQAQLAAEPDLIPFAVDEGVRAYSPIAHSPRIATGDVEVAGCPILAGDKVLLSWAGANRDEAQFDDPAAFDLDRANRAHVGFGVGPHRCLGSHLARRLLELAVARFLERIGPFRLAGEDAADGFTLGPRTPRRIVIAY